MINNSVNLIGNLPSKPELKYTPSGKPMVRTLLACDRGFGRDAGTDWIRVVVWGKAAESMAQYLDKGSKIAVSGRLVGNFYKTKDGQDRLDLEVATSQVQFLSSPKAGAPVGKSSGKAA